MTPGGVGWISWASFLHSEQNEWVSSISAPPGSPAALEQGIIAADERKITLNSSDSTSWEEASEKREQRAEKNWRWCLFLTSIPIKPAFVYLIQHLDIKTWVVSPAAVKVMECTQHSFPQSGNFWPRSLYNPILRECLVRLICDIKTSSEAKSGATFKSTLIVGIKFIVKRRWWKIKILAPECGTNASDTNYNKNWVFWTLNQVWTDSDDRWTRL